MLPCGVAGEVFTPPTTLTSICIWKGNTGRTVQSKFTWSHVPCNKAGLKCAKWKSSNRGLQESERAVYFNYSIIDSHRNHHIFDQRHRWCSKNWQKAEPKFFPLSSLQAIWKMMNILLVWWCRWCVLQVASSYLDQLTCPSNACQWSWMTLFTQ